MSYAETGSGASGADDDKVSSCTDYGKWASDLAHAYYALIKGEADLGDLMDQAYAVWPQRMNESPLEVAREWFDAIAPDRRGRYLPGGEAHEAYRLWQASLVDDA